MTFVELFAGIGGISLGLERAGHTCVGQVEIDSYCTQILNKHWPEVPKHDDVRTFQGTEFGTFDLLTGGYPCQPFSVAGNRAGETDERHLWPEMHRIIRNVRPRLVLLENVTGHLSLGFGRVLGDLAEIGYDTERRCISAAAVGAPHRRDRVFLVAYPEGEHCNVSNHHSRVSAQSGKVPESRNGCGAPNMANTEQRRHKAPQPAIFRPEAANTLERFRAGPGAQQWAVEPPVGRLADGVPHHVDQLRALGNAVVPAVAQYIGELLKTHTTA